MTLMTTDTPAAAACNGSAAAARAALQQAAFFRDLDDVQREAVLALGTLREAAAGQVFYRLGEPARDFFLLVQGTVRLTIGLHERSASAGDVLHRGQVFGWAALTPGADRRIATARCVTGATVLALDGAGLLALMERDHTLGFRLMQQLNRLVTGTLAACAAG